MAHSGANACGCQALAVTGQNFWQSAELHLTEAFARESVKREPRSEQDRGRNPAPPAVIERQVAPVRGDGGEEQPHCDPRRQQDSIRRTRPGAPVLDAGMDQQPEAGNGRIDDAADPADGSQRLLHTSILLNLTLLNLIRLTMELRLADAAGAFRLTHSVLTPEVHRLSFLAGDLVKARTNRQHPHKACYEDFTGRGFLH